MAPLIQRNLADASGAGRPIVSCSYVIHAAAARKLIVVPSVLDGLRLHLVHTLLGGGDALVRRLGPGWGAFCGMVARGRSTTRASYISTSASRGGTEARDRFIEQDGSGGWRDAGTRGVALRPAQRSRMMSCATSARSSSSWWLRPSRRRTVAWGRARAYISTCEKGTTSSCRP